MAKFWIRGGERRYAVLLLRLLPKVMPEGRCGSGILLAPKNPTITAYEYDAEGVPVEGTRSFNS